MMRKTRSAKSVKSASSQSMVDKKAVHIDEDSVVAVKDMKNTDAMDVVGTINAEKPLRNAKKAVSAKVALKPKKATAASTRSKSTAQMGIEDDLDVKALAIDLDALVAAATQRFAAPVAPSMSTKSNVNSIVDIFADAKLGLNGRIRTTTAQGNDKMPTAQALGLRIVSNNKKQPFQNSTLSSVSTFGSSLYATAGVSLSLGNTVKDGKKPAASFLSAKSVRSTLNDHQIRAERKARALARRNGQLPKRLKKHKMVRPYFFSFSLFSYCFISPVLTP